MSGTTTPTSAAPTGPVNLNADLSALIAALATDINSIVTCNNEARATLAAGIATLTTTINGLISDGTTSASTTWSSTQIAAYVQNSVAALTGLTPSQVAELANLATQVAANTASIAALNALLDSGVVRYDTDQTGTISTAQAAVARANIGAVSSNDVVNIIGALGLDIQYAETDLASIYLAARTVACA